MTEAIAPVENSTPYLTNSSGGRLPAVEPFSNAAQEARA